MSIYLFMCFFMDVGYIFNYFDVFVLVECLYCLLLDVIKDEFECVGVLEINVV